VAYVRYTREILSEAVAASTSMAGVLRHLGLRLNGGAHAHLRRRIDQLGIDTSHFEGTPPIRRYRSSKRREHTEVLVVRPVDAKREKPTALRRALMDLGRAYECAACGVGDSWNGRPLTLHIDHIDGQFWDCRPDNVQFLCPNCHSQTATYAGRNRQRSPGISFDADRPHIALSEQEKIEVLTLVGKGEVTTSDAARLIGCSVGHIYQLKRRLAVRGSLTFAARRPLSQSERDAVLAFALENPTLGDRNLAHALRLREDDPIDLSPSSVRAVLTAAGLGTIETRVAAAERLKSQGPV
jgi:hypothetical protein